MAIKTYRRDLTDGLYIEAEISPCVFMYDHYPLQVSFVLRRGNTNLTPFKAGAVVKDRSITQHTYTDNDVLQLLSSIAVKPCHRCGEPALDPDTCDCHRAGLCHICHAAGCRERFEKDETAEQKAIARRDTRMKKKGLRFRVTAWVHPAAGDDRNVDLYFAGRPDWQTVHSELKKLGSTVLDDYTITEL